MAIKQFGVNAHSLIKKRFASDTSNCQISIKLEVDSKQIEEINTIIDIDWSNLFKINYKGKGVRRWMLMNNNNNKLYFVI